MPCKLCTPCSQRVNTNKIPFRGASSTFAKAPKKQLPTEFSGGGLSRTSYISRCLSTTAHANDPVKGDKSLVSSQWEGIVGNVGIACAFASLVYYAAALAPDQTPLRDAYFIEKLVGLGFDDGVAINPILFSVFMLMGVHPTILTCLIVPSARSGNNVPAWPFLTLSFALGMFAIFPYLCLWQPRLDADVSPPSQEELTEPLTAPLLRAIESRWLPATSIISSVYLLYNAFSSTIPDWNAYFQYFDESKFVHVMSIDFCMLAALTPFFIWWDAEKRQWGPRSIGVPLLSVVPFIGPLVYLILRPRRADIKALAVDAETQKK